MARTTRPAVVTLTASPVDADDVATVHVVARTITAVFFDPKGNRTIVRTVDPGLNFPAGDVVEYHVLESPAFIAARMNGEPESYSSVAVSDVVPRHPNIHDIAKTSDLWPDVLPTQTVRRLLRTAAAMLRSHQKTAALAGSPAPVPESVLWARDFISVVLGYEQELVAGSIDLGMVAGGHWE